MTHRLSALLFAALFCAATSAAAQTLGVHTVTRHTNPELAHVEAGQRDYNDRNPGAYWRWANGAQVGAYRNSHRANTVYAGWALESPQWRGLTVGGGVFAATGYPLGTVLPLAAGSVAYHLTNGLALRLNATPRIGNKASGTLHLTVEYTFQ